MVSPITIAPSEYVEASAAATANLVAVPAILYAVTLTITTAEAVDSVLVDNTTGSTAVLTFSTDSAGTQHYTWPNGIRFNIGIRWVDLLTTGVGRITIAYNVI